MQWTKTDGTLETLPEKVGLYLVVVKYRYACDNDFTYVADEAMFLGHERKNGHIDGYWDTSCDWDEGQPYLHVVGWSTGPSEDDILWHDRSATLPEIPGHHIVDLVDSTGNHKTCMLWYMGRGFKGSGLIDDYWGIPEIDDLPEDLHVARWMEVPDTLKEVFE